MAARGSFFLFGFTIFWKSMSNSDKFFSNEEGEKNRVAVQANFKHLATFSLFLKSIHQIYALKQKTKKV